MTLDFAWLEVGRCRHPECITQRGGRWATVPYPSYAGLLVHPDRGPVLFDTGYGDAFFAATRPFPERWYRWLTPVALPPEQRLLAQLARRGFSAADIRHVFVSHLHADHVAGLLDLPNARIFAMRAEVESMRSRSRVGGLRRGYLPALLPANFASRLSFVEDCRAVTLPASMRPFAHGFDLFGDGTLVAVPLPGHTAGQSGLLFEDGRGRPVFLVADACWSLDAVRADRRPHWIAATLFADKGRYLETFAGLRRLVDAHPDLHVLPSHCVASRRRFLDDEGA